MNEHSQAAKLSGFQYTNPHVSDFQFKINKEYIPDNDSNSLQIKLNVKKANIKSESDGGKQQYVELNMIIGDENSPFTFNAVIGADFRWSRELDNETVDNLINKNAKSQRRREDKTLRLCDFALRIFSDVDDERLLVQNLQKRQKTLISSFDS